MISAKRNVWNSRFKGSNFLKHAENKVCFFLQARRNDEIYVDGTKAEIVHNRNTQIVSFAQSSDESGVQNKGMTKEDEADDQEDEREELLTPGDLMAFAWQISQGMVRYFERYSTLLWTLQRKSRVLPGAGALKLTSWKSTMNQFFPTLLLLQLVLLAFFFFFNDFDTLVVFLLPLNFNSIM